MDLTQYYIITDAAIILSFLAFILVCIPLCWHLKGTTTNTGCALYMFWSGSQALFQGIDMYAWRNDVIDRAPVWCDISSHWRVASVIGICSSSLCINRQLYYIVAGTSRVDMTVRARNRTIAIDCATGLGLPALVTSLYYLCQGQRYDIIQGLGCIYDCPNTWVAILCFSGWPVVIGLIAASYCCTTIYHFLKRRRQVDELLPHSRGSYYYRLMGLAFVELLGTVPMALWSVTQYWTAPRYSYVGFADLHWHFSFIPVYTAEAWIQEAPARIGFIRTIWLNILCPLLFFAFFGLAEDARRHYKQVALSTVAWFASVCGWRRCKKGAPLSALRPSFRHAGIEVSTTLQFAEFVTLDDAANYDSDDKKPCSLDAEKFDSAEVNHPFALLVGSPSTQGGNQSIV